MKLRKEIVLIVPEKRISNFGGGGNYVFFSVVKAYLDEERMIK